MITLLNGIAWLALVFVLALFARMAHDTDLPARSRLLAFGLTVVGVAALAARVALWWHR